MSTQTDDELYIRGSETRSPHGRSTPGARLERRSTG